MISNWKDSPKRSHTDVLKDLLEPANTKIIDAGCGAGNITRALTAMGAKVIGLDPGTRQLERARAQQPEGREVYIEGTAEDLPIENQSQDIILFFNSFHHVPRS